MKALGILLLPSLVLGLALPRGDTGASHANHTSVANARMPFANTTYATCTLNCTRPLTMSTAMIASSSPSDTQSDADEPDSRPDAGSPSSAEYVFPSSRLGPVPTLAPAMPDNHEASDLTHLAPHPAASGPSMHYVSSPSVGKP
jgi:hypothetical protein